MASIKSERLKIWSRANEAVGQGNLKRTRHEIGALIANIRPALAEMDDGSLDNFNKFLGDLGRDYDEQIMIINERTSKMDPLNMNEVRRFEYSQLDERRISELFRFLSDLLYEKDLIPSGD